MTRKRKRLLGCLLPALVVFLLLVVLPLVSFVQRPRDTLGDHTLSILRGADRVETFRLSDMGEGDSLGSSKEIKQFPLVAQGKTQGKAFAARLTRLMQDPRTYVGPNDSTCFFNPGVAYRVWRGRECVEVIACFHCRQMLITTKDAAGRPVHTASTDFWQMRAEFIALAKDTFPGDKELQALT